MNTKQQSNNTFKATIICRLFFVYPLRYNYSDDIIYQYNGEGIETVFEDLKRITVVTGHYGVGKTNFSLNLALLFASRGENVILIDLDIVNPYFRTADHDKMLAENGVKLLKPNFANTMLDVPSLPREISGAFDGDSRVIVDLGGDDAGAAVLGRYANELHNIDMLYLFSAFRPQTSDVVTVPEHIAAVEATSRQRVTYLVNSSNLSSATTASDIESSVPSANELSCLTEIPIIATLTLDGITPRVGNLFNVKRFVRLPWEM